MRSQVKLLEYIVRTWKHEQHYFEVGADVLTLKVEETSFLTGLSQRGATISLTSTCGGEINT